MNPFKIVSHIQTKSEPLEWDRGVEKEYIPFLVNKALSFNSDTIGYANEMNMKHYLDIKMQYDYYQNIVRKKKRSFSKWPKKTIDPSIAMVAEYYNVSHKEAERRYKVLSKVKPEQLAQIELSLKSRY